MWRVSPPRLTKVKEFIRWNFKYNRKKSENDKSSYEFLLSIINDDGKLPDGAEPEAITSKPELDVYSEYYLQAFYRLSESRDTGMALGAIRLSEIIGYGKYLEDDDLDGFITIIQSADREFINLHNAESSKKGSN